MEEFIFRGGDGGVECGEGGFLRVGRRGVSGGKGGAYVTLEVTFYRGAAEFAAVNYGRTDGAITERLLSTDRASRFAGV